jgi:hypothetical protein
MSSEAGVTDLWIMLGPHGLLALGKQFVTQTASLWQVGSRQNREEVGSFLVVPMVPSSLPVCMLPSFPGGVPEYLPRSLPNWCEVCLLQFPPGRHPQSGESLPGQQ